MAQSNVSNSSDMDSSRPRIMLSGFDGDAEREKTYMMNIIKRLGGVYLTDSSSSQAFLPSCTHIICKKPNRSEKYLAGCASGKWILTPYFLHESNSHGTWVREVDYEWGDNISPNYPPALQMAPKRWREHVKVKKKDPPFLGWSVGLVMKQSIIQPYKRIIEAGGGAATNISSWYSGQSQGTEAKDTEQGLLTHVLVTPNLREQVAQQRSDNIPCLSAEYLALYLLCDPPPSAEKYSIFRKNRHRLDERLRRVRTNSSSSHQSRKTSQELNSDEEDSSRQSDGGLSLESTPKKEPSVSDSHVKSSATASPTKLVTPPTPLNVTQAKPKVTSSSMQAMKPNVVISPAVVKVRARLETGEAGTTKPNERSLFKVFETTGPLINLSPGKIGNMKDPVIKLHDVTKSRKMTSVVLSRDQRQKTVVTPITLSKSRGNQSQISRPAPTSFKRHFSEEFLKKHHAVLQEFTSRKKRLNSPHGIVDYLYIPRAEEDEAIVHNNRDKYVRPFSRDVIVSLEATLEISYRSSYSNFLKEVSGRINELTYPPSDVIYVIMKVILLDAENSQLARSASNVLENIVTLHPPQSAVIKASKLYHKALTLMTVPDDAESSPIMVAIGNILSFLDNDDWTLWCNQDPTLGAHWTFYSRVLNLAINQAETERKQATEKTENDVRHQQKVENATLLTGFLTRLIEKDYEDVISRNDLPSNNPMIKCLIADLLWPYMTGLEPWFRRPSPNLADLVSLFVRAVEASIPYSDMDSTSDDCSDVSNASDELEDIKSCCESNSRKVLDHIGRIISVTASWCVYCDIREKERGRRTANTRPFEYELVRTLRSELEDRKMEVLELTLENLPARLRLKVAASLIQEACSLITEEGKPEEELSMELITGRFMQMVPVLVLNEGEELPDLEAPKQKYSKSSDESTTDSEEKTTKKINNATTTSNTQISKVNKRNPKGETSLHLACMNNKPDQVRRLLSQHGINPNLTDYAGWTPLGEACNHGHIECVKALLELPVQAGKDQSFHLRIDLSLCPREGQTPLHDALGNGHLDIACLLLEKGGVGLLDKIDSDERTPLDYCCDEAARSYMIEFACQLAVKERENKTKAANQNDANKVPIMTLKSEEAYREILPNKQTIVSDAWCERVRWYVKMIRTLLLHYVTSGFFLRSMSKIQSEEDDEVIDHTNYHVTGDVIVIDDSDDDDGDIRSRASMINTKSNRSFNDVTYDEIRRYANEVAYCLRWEECWELFGKHVKLLLDGNDEAFDDIMIEALNPIPTN